MEGKKNGGHQWVIEFEKKPLNISKFCEDFKPSKIKF